MDKIALDEELGSLYRDANPFLALLDPILPLPEGLDDFEFTRLEGKDFSVSGYNGDVGEELIVPSSVVRIEDDAFIGSPFHHLRLPEGLTHIGKRAFKDCHNLESVRFPASLREIEEEAFYNDLCLVSAPPSSLAMGERAYERTKFECLKLSDAAERLIESLPSPSLSEEFASALEETNAYIDGLYPEAKACIGNLPQLEEKQRRYQELLDARQAQVDAATAVSYRIEILPEPELSERFLSLLQSAREAYDGLDDEEKEFVGSYQKLLDYEEAYQKLYEADQAERNAAKEVDDLVCNLGEIALSEGCKGRIDIARMRMDALSEQAKAYLTSEEALSNAERRYAELVSEHEYDESCREKAREFDGFAEEVIHPSWVSPKHVEALEKLLQSKDEPLLEYVKDLPFLTLDSGLPKLSPSYESKLDDAFHAYAELDERAKGYVSALPLLQGGKELFERLKAIDAAAKEKAAEVDALIGDIGAVAFEDPCQERIAKAEEGYSALSRLAKSYLAMRETLEKARKGYDELYQKDLELREKAKEVEKRIVSLLLITVSLESDFVSKAAIIRRDYNSLCDQGRKYVDDALFHHFLLIEDKIDRLKASQVSKRLEEEYDQKKQLKIFKKKFKKVWLLSKGWSGKSYYYGFYPQTKVKLTKAEEANLVPLRARAHKKLKRSDDRQPSLDDIRRIKDRFPFYYLQYIPWREEYCEVYYRSGNDYYKVEPIEWKVLKRFGPFALLISDRILDYHINFARNWEKHFSGPYFFSPLRRWLNHSFCKDAFLKGKRLLRFFPFGDRVRLASRKELEKYLPKQADREARETDFSDYSGYCTRTTKHLRLKVDGFRYFDGIRRLWPFRFKSEHCKVASDGYLYDTDDSGHFGIRPCILLFVGFKRK